MGLPILLLLVLQAPQDGVTRVAIEEYLQLRKLLDVAALPSGNAVAFTVSAAHLPENIHRTELYVWDSRHGLMAVAPGVVHLQAPRWSREAQRLAFLGRTATDAAARLWIQSPSWDREPVPIDGLEGRLLDFDWAPGGEIYALTHGDSMGESQIWKAEAPPGRPERIWQGEAEIRELSVSPDGQSLAYTAYATGAGRDPANIDVFALDLRSGRSSRLTTRAGRELAPVWSADGRSLIVRAPLDPDHPNSQIELFSIPAAGGKLTNLTAAFDRSVIDHAWPEGGSLTFSAALGTETHLFAISADGGITPLTSGAYNFGAFDAARSGATLFAVRQTAGEADELWRLDGDGPRRLTNLNAVTRGWKLGKQVQIRWGSPDGLNVEGLLIYPADYVEGRTYPLLVTTNGEPDRRVRNVLDQYGYLQLFAAHGYAVLAVNPRGSRGYGQAFAQAKRNDLAGGDLIDVLAGVEHLIDLGVADPRRVAVFGQGYGALLSGWAVTRSERFFAAVANFADLDHATAERLAAWESERPLTRAISAGTPLLIISTSGAHREAAERARELHRSLDSSGAAVEYVELDASIHVPLDPRTRRELFFRELRWFDKYLKFDGQELFDFYLVGEWVAGSPGWEMQVPRAEPRPAYAGLAPESHRFLEISLSFRPDDDARLAEKADTLEFLPATSATLIGPSGVAQPFAGVVTEIFGRETLANDSASPIRVAAPEAGAPAIRLRFAYRIPGQAAEYRFLVKEFAPVRIWAPARDNTP